jgi:DNA-binding transcriptional LysR family regulator
MALQHAEERLDLNRVAIFLQVAEAEGVSAAAAKAKLPKSSVSRALSQLEDELGVQLVVRRTKQFQLTEAGQDFYAAAAKGIAQVSDARERLRRDTSIPSGKLRIAAPPGFASFVVMPAISRFVKQYPDIEIELCVTAAPVEPTRDNFDVVFTIGALADSSAKSRKLGSPDHGIFASPEYLAAHGTPKRPADLARHECVLFSRMKKKTHWRLQGPNGAVDITVHGKITVDDIFAGTVAATSGSGLIILPIHMPNNGLVRVLPDWIHRGESAQLLYADARHVPRRISAFCDAVLEHAQGSCPR